MESYGRDLLNCMNYLDYYQYTLPTFTVHLEFHTQHRSEHPKTCLFLPWTCSNPRNRACRQIGRYLQSLFYPFSLEKGDSDDRTGEEARLNACYQTEPKLTWLRTGVPVRPQFSWNFQDFNVAMWEDTQSQILLPKIQGVSGREVINYRAGRGLADKYFSHWNPCPEMYSNGDSAPGG